MQPSKNVHMFDLDSLATNPAYSLKSLVTKLMKNEDCDDESDFLFPESNYRCINDMQDELDLRDIGFRCIHINIRSLPKNIDKLKTILISFDEMGYPIDCVLICETFLTDINHDMYSIPGYNFIESHRKTKKGVVLVYSLSRRGIIIQDLI